MLQYTITEAKAKFSELFEKAFAGEEIIVTKMGNRSIILSPLKETPAKKSLIGLCKDAPFYMAEDFDEWPEEIARAFGMID